MNGALGNDSPDPRSLVPAEVKGDATWTAISAGTNASCGIQMDNSAWCWGWNKGGQLGNGSTSDTTTPTPVSGHHSWQQISTAYFHTCAITTDSALWCWGHLDENPETDPGPEPSPVEITPGTKWSTVTTGSGITCGVTNAHAALCWGWNGNGQLGSNTEDTTQTPTPVSNGDNTIEVTTGYISGISCMTKTDNSAWCWGGYTTTDDSDPSAAATQPVKIGTTA